jgi:hypothetical protein
MSLMDRRVSVPLVPLVVALVVLLVVAAVVWVRDADVRRVEAVCETWLDHRDELEFALQEIEEARERAVHHREDVRDHFNFDGVDDVLAVLVEWQGVAAELSGELGDSERERDARWAFREMTDGVARLQAHVEAGEEGELESWVAEQEARFGLVNDTCAYAWRS